MEKECNANGQAAIGDTITLLLEGDIPLEAFAKAMKEFHNLVAALTEAEGGGIEWIVEDLQPGSALATIRGRSPQREKVEHVVRDYVRVGRALQQNRPIRGPHNVSRSALASGRVIGEKVKKIRFETSEDQAVVSARVSPHRRKGQIAEVIGIDDLRIQLDIEQEEPVEFFGAITGRIQTLTNRNVLRFTLYDYLNDKAISCYLQPEQEEQMRDVWGRDVVVEGWISRDPVDGHPLAIRKVSSIVPLGEGGDYRNAREILPLQPGDELPEVRIRRLRNG